MSSRYPTTHQYEPLPVPKNWSTEEKRFAQRLSDVLDEIYSWRNRLRPEDFEPSTRTLLGDAVTGYSEFSQTLTNIVAEVGTTKIYHAASSALLIAALAAQTPPVTLAEGILWFDTAEGVLKRYTGGVWVVTSTDSLHTAYIDIYSDSIDIGSTGKVNIAAGGSLNIATSGEMNISGGTVDIKTNAFAIKSAVGNTLVSVAAAEGGGGNLVLGADGNPVAFGGNFILGVENGGTGLDEAYIFRRTDVPANSFGSDGNVCIVYNGAIAGDSFGDAVMTVNEWEVANVHTYFGKTRNWNYASVSGYKRIGNGTGGGNYDFGTYWSFSSPEDVDSLSFEFYTTKYVGGTTLSSGTTTYTVYLVAGSSPTSSTILATTYCSASTSLAKQTVTLTPASGFTKGNNYCVGVCYPSLTEYCGAAIRVDGSTYKVKLLGQESEVSHGLYIKSKGVWEAV